MPPTPARRPEKVFPHGFEVMKCDCERGAPGPPRSRASPPPSLYGCGGFRHPQHHHHPSARESLSLDSTYSKGLYPVRAPRVPQDTTDTHTPSDPTHTSKLSSLAFSSHNQIFFTRTPLKSTSRCDPPSSSPASQLPPSSATIAPCEGGSSVEAVEAAPRPSAMPSRPSPPSWMSPPSSAAHATMGRDDDPRRAATHAAVRLLPCGPRRTTMLRIMEDLRSGRTSTLGGGEGGRWSR
jgi:hypothetical protein